MGTPMCTTGLALSTRLPDSGGVPLGIIQDFRDMGREGMGQDIAQGIPIIIPVPVIPLADRFLAPAGQALVLRLQRMHRHECSSGRTRSCEDSTAAVY